LRAVSPARPLAGWPLAAIAVAALALLIGLGGGYGYHRDELYFIEAGEHPAFGYDDQPPLTPLLGWVSSTLFGQTPTGLRVLSALAFAACIVLAGLTARELGGGRGAQVLAGASFGASSAMFIGHLLSTTTFDLLAWTVLLFLVTRILGGADPRLWVAVGAVTGVALENKWLVLLLVASLAVGVVVGGRRDLLRSRWLYTGAALALAIWIPNLIWQADHGWPQRELSGQIADEDPLGTRLIFLPFQLLIVSPLLAFVWIAGLVWLLRDERAAPFRPLGFGYLALVVICLVAGGKMYYAIGWYPALLAAGGVGLERWLRPLGRRVAVGAAVVLSAVVSAVISLPVVPASSLADTPIPDLNEDVIETVAWPRFVDAVAGVRATLPAAQRDSAVIFTSDYGEAGAIARFGPSRGLPRPYSGHNSYSSFGRPPGRAGPVIAVGFEQPGYLARFFRGCRIAARYDNRLDLDNEEQNAPIWVCDEPRRAWHDMWSELHHLDA
jgi:4-amino-4-deoxy-L-arabinose transferase-like glycosyltransferase